MQAGRIRFLEHHENNVSSKGDWCLSKRLLKKSGTTIATYEKKAYNSNKEVVSGINLERNSSPRETDGGDRLQARGRPFEAPHKPQKPSSCSLSPISENSGFMGNVAQHEHLMVAMLVRKPH
jgi:hypothetical protein